MGHRDRQPGVDLAHDARAAALVVFAEVGEEEADRHSLDTQTDQVVGGSLVLIKRRYRSPAPGSRCVSRTSTRRYLGTIGVGSSHRGLKTWLSGLFPLLICRRHDGPRS